MCANGTSFVTQADPATGATVLWINNGAGHRLGSVPDLNGGTLFQDGDYQLRPAPFGATATLTDRSTLVAQTCSRL
ncbi:MAG: hypothetical protein INR65_09020 [Gluconacetobacter diazotrophicus]|nr:hypothetical protein [Gluconacetobacter diazotrophicus]